MDWETFKDFAESAFAVLTVIFLAFSVFRKTGRHLAEHSLHVTISKALLFFLSLTNFSVVFALAWNGDAGIGNVIVLCGISFCANCYAAWNQPEMAWKGGFILCGLVLILAVGSVFEDNAAQKFTFWFSRAAVIYVSALAGGILGRFFSVSFSRS